MPSTGYITVSAYTSAARLPLENVAIVITTSDGTAIAMRLTDRNGQIKQIEIPVPDIEESQAPGSGEKPFTAVNLYAHLKGYEQVEAENLQVFADTTTNQDLELIPYAELPDQWDKIVVYDTPPQNL